jgi:hypothetical protein
MSDSLAAVIAHGLLNSLAVVKNGVVTLTEVWEALSADERATLTEGVLSQAEVMADGLDLLPDMPRHRLANHLFVLRRACETLIRDGRFLSAAERADLLTVVHRQADCAAEVLHGVVRSLPPEVLVVLDGLDDDRDTAGTGSQAWG